LAEIEEAKLAREKNIKPSIDERTRQCVEPVIAKHSLAFKQETQIDVIYRPLNASK
jgi:hypothetical protein